MKRNVFSYLKLFPLLTCILIAIDSFAGNWYIQDVNPWGSTTNVTAMNNVFGAGNWTQGNTSTPAATIFQASTNVVFLEGSDGNSNMPNFINANITTIQNWVSNGGRLFMNAAPNYGTSQNWGFSGTTLNYQSFSPSVTTSVPTNQIFTGPYTPTATSYSGNYFGHGTITGSGLTTLLYNPANSLVVLCYKTWGAGIVFFGGCTQPQFWTPSNPQGYNLWYNILSYVKTFPLTGITPSVTGSPWCAGASITVNYTSVGLTFAAGNVFTVQLSNATGSFASPTTIGTLTSTATSGAIACVIPVAQAGGTGYRIRIVSSNPSFTGVDNGTDLTINPQLVPSVVISANPGNNICAGTNVTFSAAITNGGPSPTYQWKVNNVNVATTATYSSSTLNNGDQVTCVITSNAPCVTPTTATSNTITMTVNPNVTPTISITANPGNTVCVGQSVTFTAAITNGGPTPVYVWKVNGFPVGGNSPTYTTTTLLTGDQVTCTVTGNAPCTVNGTQVSNTITMTVSNNLAPTINITANPGNVICTGTSVTYTATITNGGPTPIYVWKLNNVVVGGNSPTYTVTPGNGDVITCTLTSSSTCANPTTVTSNSITMVITTNVTPAVSISVSPGTTICAGTSVTFNATATNGGPTPTYVWKVNNGVVGSNSPSYTSTTLANGDVVTCTMTSSNGCAIPATVTSNSITMTVNPIAVPTNIISANPGNVICAGTSVTFLSTITNGGPTPVYLWKLNGNPVGGNSPTYTNNTLVGGDLVTCQVTSNATCATPATVISNTITMVVNPIPVPSVSVAVSPSSTICAGDQATFTATPTNGGPTPSYQWYLNGNPTGFNSPTYQSTSLVNGDIVNVVITSNALCVSPTTATSNNITMTVNPTLVPSVSISANPGNVVCSNVPVTFTATATNPGPTPIYQWSVNYAIVGNNSPTYTSASLNNTDVVSCTMISNATCASPIVTTSNAITMSITYINTPTVSVTTSPGTTICDGTPVTFTANTAYPGPTPTYVWKKNNNVVGGNTATYTDPALANGDILTCTMTSSDICVAPVTVTSSNVQMTVNAITVPGISVTSTAPGDSICLGQAVTFNASQVNGGPSPAYHWKKNGYPVGSNVPTYSDISLQNNDQITCELVSNNLCPVPATVTSAAHTMKVTPTTTPNVSVTVTPGTIICTGSPMTYVASATGAGGSPIYKWFKNANPVGGNSPTYTDQLINDGDDISCVVLTSSICTTAPTDTSNHSIMSWFNSGYLAGTMGLTETNHVQVVNTTGKINYTDCDLMVSIVQSGANPVSGRTTFKVTLDSTVKRYKNQPYLTRHFDITPDSNAANATATVTLYAYQSEFDAYNAVAGPAGYPLLPNYATDNGNIRITAFHGTGTKPGNYTGAEELIVPASVTWDTAGNWWVMSFPVTGFSGYYIHTGGNFPLAVSNVNANDDFLMEAFPNPVQDKISVRIEGTMAAHSTLVVTDLAGRVIISTDLDNNKALIDMSSLASGMYLLRYNDDKRSETIKITKQ
ncbi:MAG: T9SS type A sorting domain-containing protein [Bacteroidetes bacterium]|nr:T9SS type A sorting domain-containing protein [Bacteroidota bacterium]